MKNKRFVKFTSTVLKRFLVALLIYTIVLFAFFFITVMILELRTWYGNEPFYSLFNWIDNNRIVFYIFCWLLGFAVIFCIYWRKLLGFISEIVNAINQLVLQDDNLINLPEELKQIEDKMNETKQNSMRNMRLAKESEQRKNDLLVYLAHDLKTPLTSVIGYLALLRDEQQISEELRERYLSIAVDKANRLEDLINEFFEITRFNLHEVTLETRQINLSMMLFQMSDEMLPLMDEKHLSIRVDIPDGIMINADSSKLARVFENLFRNAINYSYENSDILVSAVDEDTSVQVKIQNTGDTIPAQNLERIFEQFFRLDTARMTRSGGSGLGLAIARQIVELHGGTITAVSTNNITEFIVTLPK